MDILTIFVATIFVNNILLAQFLGNCPYLGCSREKVWQQVWAAPWSLS